MTAAEDHLLVTRARAGDREAFGALAERHGRAMLAIARAYFASEADAEDAVQEAFMKAFRALDDLHDEICFAAWVAQITRNSCLEILRTKSDKMSLADFATSVPLRPRQGRIALTPATLAGKGEEADLLRAAIGRLPEEQRLVIMLRYVEGLRYEQIAAYLDLPASTVRTRAHRAREALRGLLPTLGDTVA